MTGLLDRIQQSQQRNREEAQTELIRLIAKGDNFPAGAERDIPLLLREAGFCMGEFGGFLKLAERIKFDLSMTDLIPSVDEKTRTARQLYEETVAECVPEIVRLIVRVQLARRLADTWKSRRESLNEHADRLLIAEHGLQGWSIPTVGLVSSVRDQPERSPVPAQYTGTLESDLEAIERMSLDAMIGHARRIALESDYLGIGAKCLPDLKLTPAAELIETLKK